MDIDRVVGVKANPEVLRNLREQAEFTQHELCAGIVTQGHYSLIERGVQSTTRKVLRQIAERLSVDVETIIAEEERVAS